MIPESLISIRELSSSEVLQYLSLANSIKQNSNSYLQSLKGKTVLHFFSENSTRTRMSFEVAIRKMGGENRIFASGDSSLNKGESLLDTVLTLKQFGVDAIVFRHASAGAAEWVKKIACTSVVNAGDGSHEHPTQALIDAFVLGEHWGVQFNHPQAFEGKKILILGDTLHSRVARSNIHLLTKLGAKVFICGPKTLTIKNMDLFPTVERFDFPDKILPELDAVMTLRIQRERQTQGLIPSEKEYRYFWGLTRERARLLKKEVAILHPGPMNREIEIDSEVASSTQSLVLKQVENGVFVRMAVLGKLIGGAKE